MKKLIFITLLSFTASFGSILKAQNDDLYSYMEQYLTNDEKDQVSRAKSTFEKGKKLDSQIKEEDGKIDKYFSKKSKKGEKKSVEAKTLRIKQAVNYEQAYGLLYNVYADKVGEGVFNYEEDEAKVNRLVEDASTDNTSAAKKIKSYKSVTAKDLKKEISYTKLKSDIEGMSSLYEQAIKKLIEAYTVVVDQEQKKQLEDEENRSWQNAQSENTIYGYQGYLSDYPKGKYASEARNLISELEAIEKKKQDESNKTSFTGNLVYQVQIAASKTKLPTWKLAQFYKATKEIEEKMYEQWYKYSVGSFKTYEEAKAYVKKIKVKGAFVVAYAGGNKIDIKEAIKASGK